MQHGKCRLHIITFQPGHHGARLHFIALANTQPFNPARPLGSHGRTGFCNNITCCVQRGELTLEGQAVVTRVD